MSFPHDQSFGGLLKRRRLAAGLTQEALAERAGISEKAVSDLERHPLRAPRLETVSMLADALHLEATQRNGFFAVARPADASSSPQPLGPRPLSSLPRPLTPTLGRAFEVGALEDLVLRGSEQMITLIGPGGVGKTRLAIEVAARAAVAFADGVVFVDLTPLRDPDRVMPTIARSLGLREDDLAPLRQRLLDALRQRHLLLVMDNIEHVIECRDLLLDLVAACPRLVVLATSREALRTRGERAYSVTPLDLPDAATSAENLVFSPAVELFIQRARAVGADPPQEETTLRAVAEICRRLDGLPLAIELAAAWTPFLPPPSLLGRLASRLPLLVDGPHDLPVRQKTMRDSIAWSYDLLTPREQRLFRRLGVFADGCTVNAAESVCGEEGDAAALRWLADLAHKSLLRLRSDPADGEPRATLLATVREFAVERLAAEGEAERVQGRHATYYRELAERTETHLVGREQVLWGDVLEREIDNLRAALQWAIDVRGAEVGLRLAGSLWRFWRARGYVAEGHRWLDEVLAIPLSSQDAADVLAPPRVKALLGASLLAIDRGDHDAASALSDAGEALARERGSAGDLVAALNARGLLEQQRGQYRAATAAFEEALAGARDLGGDRIAEATALTGLGTTALLAGEMSGATAVLEQGVAAYRMVDEPRGLGQALVYLGLQAHSRGDIAEAVALSEEALALFRGVGDTGAIAHALFGLGVARRSQGQFECAKELLEESLLLRRVRGDEHAVVQSLGGLALVMLDLGDSAWARELVEEAQTVIGRFDDPWAEGMTRAILGHVEVSAGNSLRAHEQFVASSRLFQTIGNPLFLSWDLEGLTWVEATQGNWDLAARLCGARDTLGRWLGSSLGAAVPAVYDRTVASIRSALGEDAFVAARDLGQRQSLDDVLAEAQELKPTLD